MGKQGYAPTSTLPERIGRLPIGIGSFASTTGLGVLFMHNVSSIAYSFKLPVFLLLIDGLRFYIRTLKCSTALYYFNLYYAIL